MTIASDWDVKIQCKPKPILWIVIMVIERLSEHDTLLSKLCLVSFSDI